MMSSNILYHEEDGTNTNKSWQQKYQIEKEITDKRKKSGNRNDPTKVKRRLAKLEKKKQQEKW